VKHHAVLGVVYIVIHDQSSMHVPVLHGSVDHSAELRPAWKADPHGIAVERGTGILDAFDLFRISVWMVVVVVDIRPVHHGLRSTAYASRPPRIESDDRRLAYYL